MTRDALKESILDDKLKIQRKHQAFSIKGSGYLNLQSGIFNPILPHAERMASIHDPNRIATTIGTRAAAPMAT
jgi:hypothetical protein